jgi:hypothetical protein
MGACARREGCLNGVAGPTDRLRADVVCYAQKRGSPSVQPATAVQQWRVPRRIAARSGRGAQYRSISELDAHRAARRHVRLGDAKEMAERHEWLDQESHVRQVHLHPRQISFADSTYWDYGRLLLDFILGPGGRAGMSSRGTTSYRARPGNASRLATTSLDAGAAPLNSRRGSPCPRQGGASPPRQRQPARLRVRPVGQPCRRPTCAASTGRRGSAP